MLGFGFIHSGRDILISHWISCSPLRRQQDWALLLSASLQRAVTALNPAGEMWVWRTSPSLRGHFWIPLMYWGRPASPDCLSESEKPHRGDPSVQIPWIQGALVEFCLFSFPFPLLVYWQGRQYIGYSGTATGCCWYLAQQVSNTPPKNGCGIPFLPIW